MFPLIARFIEFNLIEENNFQFACNNLEFKELMAGEPIFSNKHSYKNFTIIIKGKVLVKSVKNAVGYNNLKMSNTISLNISEMKKFAQERNQVGFEFKKPEYSEKEYSKGQYFSKKIKSKNGTVIFSAVALEDTIVAVLDGKTYEVLFEKSILKAERERKNFIYKTLHTMKDLGPTRFDAFFRDIEVNVIFIFLLIIFTCFYFMIDAVFGYKVF